MEFLAVFPAELLDRLTGLVPDGEPQFAPLPRLQSRGAQVERVPALGDLKAPCRAGRAALPGVWCRRAPRVFGTLRGAGGPGTGAHGGTDAVRGAEGRRECGDEGGDLRGGVHDCSCSCAPRGGPGKGPIP